MGRFMSPDWADKPEAVSYSDLSNPQSLNLYGYVNNNPLSKADKDGHCPECAVWADEALQWVSETPAGQQVENWGMQGLAAGGALLGAALSGVGGNAYPSYYHGEFSDGSMLMKGNGSGNTSAPSGNSGSNTGSASGPEGPYKNTPENKQRMSEGKAPVGKDGKPVELHHEGQDPKGPVKEMTQSDHRGGDNFKKNHENTGQQPSKIDRKQWNQDRQEYWKDKANQ